MQDEYIKPEEAAIRLRVHEDTIRDWCRTGRLRATKVGKQWRIKPQDIDAFLRPNEGAVKKADGLAAFAN